MDKKAGKGDDLGPAGSDAQPLEFGKDGNIGDHHRAIGGEDHLKYRVATGNLVDFQASPGLDPHAAFVGKSEQDNIGFEILRTKAGDNVVGGLWTSVENADGGERGQAHRFQLGFNGFGRQLRFGHLHSGPAKCAPLWYLPEELTPD
jgi:hypothetical protein